MDRAAVLPAAMASTTLLGPETTSPPAKTPGRVVAMLAGIAAEPMRPEVRNFPALMRDCGGWRRSLADQGIEDLSAVMEPGLAALLAVHARGIDPATAALALWQEFCAARAALLALTPPPEELAPRRFT